MTKKTDLTFFCTTKENTHGVPVVMNNIADYLQEDGMFNVNFVTNNFDNTDLELTHHNGGVFSFGCRRELASFMKRHGIKVDVFHTHSWHPSDYYKPFHTPRDPTDLVTFLSDIGKPRLVYTDHSNPTEDLRRIRERHGIDYRVLRPKKKFDFCYSHLLDYVKSWELGWEATAILSKKQLIDEADIVTFVSEQQMREEEELIPLANYTMLDGRDKRRVVENGVDLNTYNTPETHEEAEKLRREMGIGRDEQVILYAGRLDEEKGIFDLAQAAKILAEDRRKITLVYLGSNGHDEETKRRLQEIARGVPIHFPKKIGSEEREKMAAMYAAADVVAQPTWGECFNQVAAEAMAMGTPVVISDYSAPREIYVRPGAAFGSRVRDPSDIADKLLTSLFDERQRAEKIRKGSELVRTSLNVGSMGRKYAQIYDELMRT